jgi:hypothetical protein
MPISAFAIAASQNTDGKNDATGAFIPGAQKFAAGYDCPWRPFDNTGSRAVVRKRFLDTIATHCPGGINLFAYFGHGIPAGLPSANIYGDDIDDFLRVLMPKIAKPFVAVFYACSSGAAQGFTGKLRAKLGSDAWVYGHTTAGHSFLNPDVSEEASSNSPSWRMLYGSGAELRGPWYEALRYTDLWLRFPMMEDDEIDAELNARRLLGKWEVNVSGAKTHYEFDWPATAWSSDDDIASTPTGSVKVVNQTRPGASSQGEWEISDKLYVTWPSGSTEEWPLPLRVVRQQGTADGSQMIAKRISHPASHGRLQG